MKTCSIDECEKQTVGRGWCRTHYNRWHRHGTTDDPPPRVIGERRTDPEAIFLARTEPLVGDPGCIIWTGALSSGGYGHLTVNGQGVKAHRYAWEREHGPIPGGMLIDHMCWDRSCVNTEHLRLATPQQNNSYLSGVRKNGGGLPRGVSRYRRRYMARVSLNGAEHYLGLFDTPEEASAVADAKRKILFGEFAGRA